METSSSILFPTERRSTNAESPVNPAGPRRIFAARARAALGMETGRGRLFWAIVLLAGTVLAYQPAWQAGFVWDDDAYVTDNPLLSAPDGLRRIWFSTDSPSQYFPLVYTVLRLEYGAWGLNATGYHWVNLLLHATNALLVWGILRRLRLPGAWFAAAIFALHPVQVESVAWVTELKNVLSLFFTLIAFAGWLTFTGIGAAAPAGRRWYALALGCYALALCSKTTACTLPAALLVVGWWREGKVTLRRALQVLPFVVLGLAMGLVTIWWERHHQGTQGEGFTIGWLERFLIAGRAAWFYLGKLVWPAGLSFSYGRWEIDAARVSAYAGLGAAVTAVVFLWRMRARLGRGPIAAAVFFVATLSPMLGFVMLYTFRYAFVADHYQYVAMIGPIAAGVAGVAAWRRKLSPSRQAGVAMAGFATVITLGVLTARQGRMYADVETLWRATLERTPNSFIAHANLAAALVDSGRPDEAIGHAEQALALRPTGADLALTQVTLGNAWMRKGDPARGMEHFRRALVAAPGFANAHNNLGSALLDQGRDDQAQAQFEAALRSMPRHGEAHYHLGHVAFRRQDYATAIQHYRLATQLRPRDADARNDLATALYLAGQADAALQEFEAAVALKPDFARAHANLGMVLRERGNASAAQAHLQRAAELEAGSAERRGAR